MTTSTSAIPTQREPALRGQTVVLVGGSAGIGLATARQARTEGADVVLTGRDPERLKREIGEVRHADVAFDDGEFDVEIRCAAMPIRDFTGQVVGAIGISGPIWRLSLQALQSHSPKLRDAAERLSGAFGARPSDAA